MPVAISAGGGETKSFSAAAAKKKWQSLEKTINQLALNKQAVASMEREMERLVVPIRIACLFEGWAGPLK